MIMTDVNRITNCGVLFWFALHCAKCVLRQINANHFKKITIAKKKELCEIVYCDFTAMCCYHEDDRLSRFKMLPIELKIGE